MAGRHRDPRTLRLASLFSLVVALAATGFMLAARPTTPPVSSSSPTAQEVKLAEAYPGAVPVTLARPGYQPMFFVDENRSLGTAAATDGAVQLLLRDGETERELRRRPKDEIPEFGAFTADGDRIVWMEMTFAKGDQGQSQVKTELWTIDSLAAVPRMITADTGDVALFDKRGDVAIHEGEVSWVSAAPTENPQTEVRTVALSGGPVRVDTREGMFSFADWPWLATVSAGPTGSLEMRNLLTDERTIVPVQPNELMACSPTWCRSVIVGTAEGSTIIEVQRPSGLGRFRSGSGSVAAALADVAILDRFEVYSYAGGKLVVFDVNAMRSIVVAPGGVTQIVSRGSVLWWSTGDNEALTWHALDLRKLSP